MFLIARDDFHRQRCSSSPAMVFIARAFYEKDKVLQSQQP
jgi:hypothetical protein